MNSAITRRHFARTLALPAGAVLLGSALPAWAKGRNTGNATDILYAYSDDGGKTVHKSEGTQIPLPIRAEAGPNQGEVILREMDAHVDPFCAHYI